MVCCEAVLITLCIHDDLIIQRGRHTRTDTSLFILASKVCLQFVGRNVMFCTENGFGEIVPFVMPLRGNESDCNLVFHFPCFIAPHMHAYIHTRQSCGAQASLMSVYFDLHVCFMSVENVFCLASFPL